MKFALFAVGVEIQF